MPALSSLSNNPIAKVLYIGDSGTGKTGSLASLVAAGYKLRVLDFDNNIQVLQQYVMKTCPKFLGNVEYISLRDTYSVAPSGIYKGKEGPVVKSPRAFTDGLKFMQKWEDGSDPSQWGPEYVMVVDSGSSFGKAAFAWAQNMNPAAQDPRQWYFTAQKAFEDTVALLTSDAFATNLVFISHVNYKEVTEGVTKGHANTIGTALGPVIGRYFNDLILAEVSGFGKNVKRKIKTLPTGIIDLKSSVNWKLETELPLETGLADLFTLLKNGQSTSTTV